MKFTNQYDKPAWESVGYTYPGLMTQSFSTLFGLWLAIKYIPPQSPLMSIVWGGLCIVESFIVGVPVVVLGKKGWIPTRQEVFNIYYGCDPWM